MNVKSKNVASASTGSASTSSATATATAATQSNIAPSWSKVSPLRGDGRGAVKTRFIASLMTIFFLVLSLNTANAQGGQTGPLTWVINGNTLTISGNGAMPDYTFSSGAPWSSYMPSVHTIIIESGVTRIGDYAFSSNNPTSVTIPSSVTSIGISAFYNCSMPSINIPSSVTTIGAGAFAHCESLTSITIHPGIISMGSDAFSYCSTLQTINYNAINCADWTDSYGSCPFYACNALSTLNIGNGVQRIPAYVFKGCDGITTVTIPNSVTSIGKGAFKNCGDLTSINIPFGVTSIEDNTFYHCTNLSSITIPESVTNIGTYAFFQCSSLHSITIPYGVTTIEISTFYGCSSLQLVILPYSVTSIEAHAFRDCSSLPSINITNNLTSIGAYAFNSCSSLTSVKIPKNVTSIGTYAFAHCTNLTSFTNLSLVPVGINSNVFTGVNQSNCTLKVANSAVSTYSNTDVWKNFNVVGSGYLVNPISINNLWGWASGDGLYPGGKGTATVEATALSGYHFVKWTKNGSQVSTSNPYTFTVTENVELVAVFEAATAPVITTTTLPNGTTGTAYSAQLTATGDTPITWTLQSGSLPTGLTLSSAGLISGTPTAAGTSNFTVKATNSAGSDTKALSITVIAATIPPTITTTTLPGGLVGTAYSQQLAATGTAPITWTLESGNLPTGLTLSTAGVISGTPTAAGTSNFTVKATNSAGSDTKALSIVVTSTAVAPVITTTTLPAGTTGTAYSAQLEATGTAPITWTLESGNLPTGLTLSSIGKISGTPTVAGTSNFTVKAANSAGNATKALSITIIASTVSPVITTTTLPGGLIGTAYNTQLAATGTTPITWTLQSGNLPTGLTLSTTGLIAGTPTVAGTSTFTVKAANSAGNDSKNLSIEVTVTAVAPVITTTALPNGSTCATYSAQLEATGTAPITWTLESGALPIGLTISPEGLLSGTPTTAQTSDFTVKATNSAGNDSRMLSIKIEDCEGIEELGIGNIIVFPNPTDGEIIINNEQLTINNVEIFDVLGRPVGANLRVCPPHVRPETQTSDIVINISHLPTGMYFVRITTENGVVVRKIIRN